MLHNLTFNLIAPSKRPYYEGFLPELPEDLAKSAGQIPDGQEEGSVHGKGWTRDGDRRGWFCCCAQHRPNPPRATAPAPMCVGTAMPMVAHTRVCLYHGESYARGRHHQLVLDGRMHRIMKCSEDACMNFSLTIQNHILDHAFNLPSMPKNETKR